MKRWIIAALLLLLVSSGCGKETVASVLPSESYEKNMQQPEEVMEAALLGTRLCWEIPDGYKACQTDDGFIVIHDGREIGFAVRRMGLGSTKEYNAEARVKDDLLQSTLVDMLDTFEETSNITTIRIAIDGQDGFLTTGEYDEDRSLMLICMQFDSDIVLLTGVSPQDTVTELESAVNAVKVLKTLNTEWRGSL